ncbi:MBL fold metallo-hydrolase [bacterium]|nr:MBL fold metallo-hydrolase [bacterium]
MALFWNSCRIKFIFFGLLLWSSLPLFSQTDSSSTRTRTVSKIADGIYMIRHKDSPDGFPQGNTTVIIGDREVFVVDACYLPSSAKEDIAQIQQWTNKPVRYLLNTHWHFDHTMGNGTYAEAFPSITIIAHQETCKQMEGYNPGWFQRFPNRADLFKKYVETGKDANGNPLSEQDKKDYTSFIAGIEPVWQEFKKIKDRMPNLTFDSELTLDIGNREIQIKYLGRGNTAGDAVVYLPKEKILIAGDLLDSPVPYLGSGYPSQHAKTLRKMAQLDFEILIPGHGNTLKGKTYLNLVADFIQTVVDEVSKAIFQVGGGPRNLEIVRQTVHKTIDFDAWKKKIVGDSKEDGDFFDGFSVQGVVTAAYAEAWGR